MREYDHKKIENKWQKEWERSGVFHAQNNSKKPKYYSLIEFPYPSGDGLHVGHPRPYIGMDIISRKKRLEGFNVLYPIGWDAFGLPTENYAIKTGRPPAEITKKNSDTFRRQIKSLGVSFDWSREINTTDPKYYKWTQWIFLQFLKKGLAYKTKMDINWCPKDKIGLANEEVVGGCCERCGTPVEKREKEQWMLAITKYADRLDKDLDNVDYLPQIKLGQRNWIGRSEGAEIEFKLIVSGQVVEATIKVFTTRAETLFGATYIVLAPEHELVKTISIYQREIEQYLMDVKEKSELERTDKNKEKTGVELKGITAINPANGKKIPIWIADYVLVHYGTGAIMAVPAHDERDFVFANKYNLPILPVIFPIKTVGQEEILQALKMEQSLDLYSEYIINNGPFIGTGYLVNSSKFNGNKIEKARQKITKFVNGKFVTTFKLRDWIFSRQRYWGEPIPVIHCDKCGIVPVPEKDLPVELPKVKNYQPTDSGESPLANIAKWVNVRCPKCKGPAKRETDTMPNWAGSSWYYLRYTDPKNKKEFASKKNLKYWLVSRDARDDSAKGGVDWYNGGNEHTTLHLLYSRFWHKFLFDLGLAPTSEPYRKRTSHGMILGEGGVKMSKSLGNVINPDEIVKIYGADTLRVYEMFMGPFNQSVAWSTESIIGARRFIEKVWRIGEKVRVKPTKSFLKITLSESKGQGTHTFFKNSLSASLEKLLHKTIKKVSEDIEEMRFNTAISSMMILVAEMEKAEYVPREYFEKFLQILSPFAPHIAEELWSTLGEKKSINFSDWPKSDENLIQDDEIKIAAQVNGKIRTEIAININEDEKEIKKRAVLNEVILKYMAGKDVKKIIYVKNRIINIIV